MSIIHEPVLSELDQTTICLCFKVWEWEAAFDSSKDSKFYFNFKQQKQAQVIWIKQFFNPTRLPMSELDQTKAKEFKLKRPSPVVHQRDDLRKSYKILWLYNESSNAKTI